MRSILLTFTLAALPAAALAQSQCAVQVPAKIAEPLIPLPSPIAVGGPQVPLTPTPTPTAVNVSAPPAPAGPAAATKPEANAEAPKPLNVAVVPALAHMVAAGATLSDLGAGHGLRTVTARHGDEVMVLEVAPDGQAAVQGLMSDMTVAQLLALGGDRIRDLGPQHGLEAYYLRTGVQFQVFYGSPDRERIIPGVMWDAEGQNLTRDLVASIPGTIPTVTIGGDAAPAATQVNAPAGEAEATVSGSLLAIARGTVFGEIGSPAAPELWMFIDPQCAFSIRAMQQLAPYVASGKVRLAVIPLSILDHEDNGLSTRAALNLVSLPSDQLVRAWEDGRTTGTPAADAGSRLQTNMNAAAAIQLRGTPTFVWRKVDGSEGRLDGIPRDIAGLVSSVGR